MATLSAPFPIVFRGQAADLRVVRNNGFCWGEVRTPAGDTITVDCDTPEDLYDEDDCTAAEVLAGFLPA